MMREESIISNFRSEKAASHDFTLKNKTLTRRQNTWNFSYYHHKIQFKKTCMSTCWMNSGRHRAEDPSPKPCMGDKLLGANIPPTNHNHSFAFQRCIVGKTAVFYASKSHVQPNISHLHPLFSLWRLIKCFQQLCTEVSNHTSYEIAQSKQFDW